MYNLYWWPIQVLLKLLWFIVYIYFLKNAIFQLEISEIQVVIFPLSKFITLNSIYRLHVHPGTQS